MLDSLLKTPRAVGAFPLHLRHAESEGGSMRAPAALSRRQLDEQSAINSRHPLPKTNGGILAIPTILTTDPGSQDTSGEISEQAPRAFDVDFQKEIIVMGFIFQWKSFLNSIKCV